MTTAEKTALKAELRAEILAEMQKKQQTPNLYSKASAACKAHFISVQLVNQNYGGQFICENAVRTAFKEKHGITDRQYRRHPSKYIDTEQAAQEYISLFKEFMDVYQRYLEGRKK